MGQNDDLRLLLAFLTGFVIFSLPLMANDTRRVWAPRPAGSDQPPPGPPDPYPHYQSDDNDPGWKFRRAITDGDLDEAERLYTASLAADHEAPGFRAIALRPGIFETGMQQFMRSRDPAEFPSVGLFRGFKDQGILKDPADVAARIVATLVEAPVDHGRIYSHVDLQG